MSIIMANHLKKSFGVDVVLEDVSFHIDPGDKIALLGVNGAGKTTLFRLLTGELSADEGEISYPANCALHICNSMRNIPPPKRF